MGTHSIANQRSCGILLSVIEQMVIGPKSIGILRSISGNYSLHMTKYSSLTPGSEKTLAISLGSRSKCCRNLVQFCSKTWTLPCLRISLLLTHLGQFGIPLYGGVKCSKHNSRKQSHSIRSDLVASLEGESVMISSPRMACVQFFINI